MSRFLAPIARFTGVLMVILISSSCGFVIGVAAHYR